MKWRTIRIFFLLALLLFPAVLSAQGIQIDKRAIEQVGKNAAAAVSAERLVEESVEKTTKAQEVINKYTTIIQANVQHIYKMQTEVDAFKASSYAIKEFVELLGYTKKELTHLASDIAKNPKTALVYHRSFSSLYKETIGIGTHIVALVTDGREPLSGLPRTGVYENLLTPTKRLHILNQCIYELSRVLSMARNIRLAILRGATARTIALELNTTSVLSADLLAQIREDVIKLWKKDYYQ